MVNNNLSSYERWEVNRWDTIFSNAENLLLDSLTDGKNGLLLKFSDSKNRTFIINFPPFCCYRNINESYRNNLWRKLKENGQLVSLGNSWIADESDLLSMLREDPIWLSQNNKAKHFVFVTAEDVIEVVSSVEPTVTLTS